MLQINRKVFSLVRCSTDLAIKWAKLYAKSCEFLLTSIGMYMYVYVHINVYVCVCVYLNSYYTCWALREVFCQLFKLSADFTKNLHGYPLLDYCLSLLFLPLSLGINADYLVVYLVTKSRFLFKLKSSLTPGLNIIIKWAKKPTDLKLKLELELESQPRFWPWQFHHF